MRQRIISFLLAISMVCTLATTAFASANGAPYSLAYLSNIDFAEYKKYIALEDASLENAIITNRTLEMYDAFTLWIKNNGSWSAVVAPFREKFLSSGFQETISRDVNGQEEYSFILNNDIFSIKSEKASQAVINESGLVFIEHGYVVQRITDIEAQQAADELNALGLFNGTGTDTSGKPIYDLGRAPTRQEAIVMLVRLLGKESEAKAGTWTTPFTDVDEWAKPYIGYAYTHKLTSGTSATTFGGTSIMTAPQFITLVLRALGYVSGTDFQWEKAWEMSDKIGLTSHQYNVDTTYFTRGDAAILSYNALFQKMNGEDNTLFNVIRIENNDDENHTEQGADTKAKVETKINECRQAILDANALLSKAMDAAKTGDDEAGARYVIQAYPYFTKAMIAADLAVMNCGSDTKYAEVKRLMQSTSDFLKAIEKDVPMYTIDDTNYIIHANSILTGLNLAANMLGRAISAYNAIK